jgi:beta-lactamase regulating signal transducer with metallopeptidase domain
MSAVYEVLTHDSLVHLVYALLHTLWQGAILAGGLYFCLRRTAATRANLRYGISLGAMLLIVMSCALTWAILDYEPKVEPSTETGKTLSISTDSAVASSPAITVHDYSTTATPPPPVTLWTTWAVGIWLLGAALTLLRTMLLLYGARRSYRRCVSLCDGPVSASTEQLRHALGIMRKVRVVVGEHIQGPAVHGLFWPVILLPASLATGMPGTQLQAILAHELAHIRRFDYLVNALQMVLESLLFFNPAIWWISRQARIEREACCDRMAVYATGQHAEYAHALVDYVSEMKMGMQMAFSGSARPSGLMDRVKRIVVPGHRPYPRIPWYSMVALLLGAGIALAALWHGANLSVSFAADMLTHEERVEQIAQIEKTHGSPARNYGDSNRTKNIKVSGTVRTHDGKPVSKNRCRIRSDNTNSRHSTFSGTNVRKGRFSGRYFSGLLYLCAYQKGYAPEFLSPIVLQDGSDVEDLDIVLKPGYSAGIRVVGDDGKPAVGVESVGVYAHQTQFNYKAKTDATGYMAVDDCTAVPIKFSIRVDGYEYDQREFLLQPNVTAEWVLKTAEVLTGVVVDKESGKPVCDAQFGLVGRQGAYECSWDPKYYIVLDETDKEGRFELNSLRSDCTYTFMVRAAGYEWLPVRGVTTHKRTLNVELGPPLVVSGIIKGGKGKLLADKDGPYITYNNDFRFAHNSTHSWGGKDYVDIEGEDAFFVFNANWAGNVRIEAGNKSFTLDISSPTDNVTLDLSEFPVNMVTREVIFRFIAPDDAQPPTGSVHVQNFIDNRGRNGQLIDVLNGLGRVHIPVPGAITMSSNNGLSGFWVGDSIHKQVSVGNGPFIIDVTAYPAGSIFGGVTEADGSPASSALMAVVVVKKPDELKEHHISIRCKDSAAYGDLFSKYNATPIPLGGTYAIVAYKHPRYAVSEPIRVDEKKPIHEVNLSFAKGVSIKSRVLGPDNKPLAGIAVKLSYMTPWRGSYGGSPCETDRDGMFEFQNIDPKIEGQYTLVVSPQGKYQTHVTKVNFNNIPIAIVLKRGIKADGVLLYENTGEPVVGAKVTANGGGVTIEAEGITDGQGRFQFSNLEDKEYWLTVRYGHGHATINSFKPTDKDNPKEYRIKLL